MVWVYFGCQRSEVGCQKSDVRGWC